VILTGENSRGAPERGCETLAGAFVSLRGASICYAAHASRVIGVATRCAWAERWW
jgi:hypothetical protein